MKKLTILCDADDTIQELTVHWLAELNQKYNYNVKKEDVTSWDITKAYPELTPDEVLEPLYYERISAMSHGTGTWTDNAEELIQEGINITELISCRDDVMLFLRNCGYEKEEAYKIAERVRKGKQVMEEQYRNMRDCEKKSVNLIPSMIE